eukprot:6319801-Pyramimonas_sp.AAC.1
MEGGRCQRGEGGPNLGVFVGHDGADGLHDGEGGEVLGGDELEALPLAVLLLLDDVAHLGVNLLQALVADRGPLRAKVEEEGREASAGGKGSSADGKGSSADGKGSSVDGEGRSADDEGNRVDGEGSSVDGKGNRVNGEGSSADGEGNRVDGKGSSADVKGPATEEWETSGLE